MNKLPNIKDILINTFNTLITQFIDFVPKIIGSIVVLLLGILVAKIAAFFVKNILSRIGFDKIGDKLNEIEAIKRFNVEIKLSVVVSKLLYGFIILVFIIAAADTLGVPAISNIVLMLVAFLPKLIAALIMMLAGLALADFLRGFVVSMCKSFGIASGKLLGMAVFFFFLIITIIAALGQAGINTALLESTFNVIIGGIIVAFAVGYGFASKDILANMLTSIYSRKKFKEGQIIEIQGVKGEIIQMDNTNLTLDTGDTQTIFPLSVLQTTKIIVFNE